MARGDRSTAWGFGVTDSGRGEVIIVNVSGAVVWATFTSGSPIEISTRLWISIRRRRRGVHHTINNSFVCVGRGAGIIVTCSPSLFPRYFKLKRTREGPAFFDYSLNSVHSLGG